MKKDQKVEKESWAVWGSLFKGWKFSRINLHMLQNNQLPWQTLCNSATSSRTMGFSYSMWHKMMCKGILQFFWRLHNDKLWDYVIKNPNQNWGLFQTLNFLLDYRYKKFREIQINWKVNRTGISSLFQWTFFRNNLASKRFSCFPIGYVPKRNSSSTSCNSPLTLDEV